MWIACSEGEGEKESLKWVQVGQKTRGRTGTSCSEASRIWAPN